MWTRLWKTRREVVKSTKGTRVHTPFFLSHHSCLYFWLRPCRSPCVNGDPRASPQLQKSQTAKDRCKPRYESPIMALTDEELSRAGWMECRGFLRGTRPPASFVSTAGAKGAAVLCRLREEKKKTTSSWGWRKRARRQKLRLPRRSSWRRRLLNCWECSLNRNPDWSSPPSEVLHPFFCTKGEKND